MTFELISIVMNFNKSRNCSPFRYGIMTIFYISVDKIKDRYIIMIKVIVLALIIAVGLSAPAGDKVDKVPVNHKVYRDIPIMILLVSIVVILMSKIKVDLSTTSLFNPKTGLTTMIL